MCYNPFSLKGKTMLVTGAARGIGRATAIECSKMGAQVIVTARSQEMLIETINKLEGEGHSAIVADLNDNESIFRLIESVPKLDGVVLNAGISKLVPVQFVKENDLNDILRVNTIAPIVVVQQLLKKKKIGKGCSLVFTSSISGNCTFAPAHSIYSLSKAALTAFTKNAAVDLGAKKIRCNCVMPGMVETDLIHNSSLSQEDFDNDKRNYPLGRYGRPEEIAWGIIYLLSDASSFTTGANIILDGGFTLK